MILQPANMDNNLLYISHTMIFSVLITMAYKRFKKSESFGSGDICITRQSLGHGLAREKYAVVEVASANSHVYVGSMELFVEFLAVMAYEIYGFEYEH